MALPEDRRIDESKFPAQFQRVVAPDAPPQMKIMAARGLLPMPPVVQICVLYQLQLTGDEEVRQLSTDTVRRMPPATLQQVCGEPLAPVVLDWLAELALGDQALLRKVLLNPRTDGDTFLRVARLGDENTTEMIALNQARLLSTPGLIQALYLNRNTRASTADRVVDFGVRSHLDLSDLPCYEEIVAAIMGSTPLTPEQAAAADAAFREAAKVAALEPEDEGELPDDVPVDGVEEPVETERSRSTSGRIALLNVAQRVRLAMLGSRGDRQVLIKDSNKIVMRAVIRSPGVNDSEAMMYAGIKSLPDEVVTFIAHNKKWTRHYQMKKLLIFNPKTPMGEALRFLTFMRPGDLKSIASSRALPQSVAKAASQMLKSRMR